MFSCKEPSSGGKHTKTVMEVWKINVDVAFNFESGVASVYVIAREGLIIYAASSYIPKFLAEVDAEALVCLQGVKVVVEL